MKKHLFFALVLLMALPSLAQNVSVRPQHVGGHPQQNATLTVVAPQRQNCWLFVDGVLQNQDPVHSICVRNLTKDNYYIRVELDNDLQNCVGQFVDMKHSQILTVTQRGQFYGIEFSQATVRPDLTIELITEQPSGHPGTPHIMPPMPPVPPMPQGMSQKDFDDALRIISNESFDDTKLTMAKQIITGNPMTVSQIVEICKLLTFENNKLDFAKYAYPYCFDKNKYFMVNEVFVHDSSKRELMEFLQGL